MHEPVIVRHHDPVNPTELGRAEQALFHVAMRAEPEKPDFSRRLGLFPPDLHLIIHLSDVAHAVHEKQVDVIGLHPLQGTIQVFGHSPRVGRAGLGDEKNLLAYLRMLFKIPSDAHLAPPPDVAGGCIPVGNAPFQGPSQHNLVGLDIEYSPEGQGGYFHPCFPESPRGDYQVPGFPLSKFAGFPRQGPRWGEQGTNASRSCGLQKSPT